MKRPKKQQQSLKTKTIKLTLHVLLSANMKLKVHILRSKCKKNFWVHFHFVASHIFSLLISHEVGYLHMKMRIQNNNLLGSSVFNNKLYIQKNNCTVKYLYKFGIHSYLLYYHCEYFF